MSVWALVSPEGAQFVTKGETLCYKPQNSTKAQKGRDVFNPTHNVHRILLYTFLGMLGTHSQMFFSSDAVPGFEYIF